MTTHRPHRADAGFTLIELLVSIVILGIIAVPLAMGLASYFTNSGTTTARLTQSAQVQIASSYFARDISMMGIRDTSAAPAPPPLPPFPYQQSVWTTSVATGIAACGTLTGSLIVGGDDYSDDPTHPTRFYIAYQRVGTDLHRIRCAGAARSDTVIARNISQIAAPACSSACTAVPPPASVSLAVTVAVSGGSDLFMTLTGSRMQTAVGVSP